MRLIAREPTNEDFDSYYYKCFPYHRNDREARNSVEHEWRTFIGHPAGLSLIVEDLDLAPNVRFLCCAQVVFVTDKFVEWARVAAFPWISRIAAQRLPDGSEPLISAEEVEYGCTEQGSLNVLLTEWGRGDAEMPPEYRRCAYELRQREFYKLMSGYRIGQIICECMGIDIARQAQHAGFKIWSDYQEYFHANPPVPPDESRQYLLGITREEAEDIEGSLISHYFAYRPRRFAFTADERSVVQYALIGDTEAATAAAIDESVSRVKYLWRIIYEKVDDIEPALFASLKCQNAPADHRGAEKRRLLLAYLRDHPEELRKPRSKAT